MMSGNIAVITGPYLYNIIFFINKYLPEQDNILCTFQYIKYISNLTNNLLYCCIMTYIHDQQSLNECMNIVYGHTFIIILGIVVNN